MQLLVWVVLWAVLIILVILPGPSRAHVIQKIPCHWICPPYDFRDDWFHPRPTRPCNCVASKPSMSANCSGVPPCNVEDPSSMGRDSSVKPTIAKAVGGSL